VSRRFHVLAIVSVPLVVLAFNVRLLASDGYLRLAFARPGLTEAPGFSAEERWAAASVSTRFVVSTAGSRTLAELRHRDQPLYTPEEIAHLVDVQRLVLLITGLGLAGALLLAVAVLSRLRGADRARLGLALRRGGWLCVALVMVPGLGVLLAWPLAFTRFHEVLFAPGTWQFPPDSSLIRLFPERFWFDAAVLLLGLIVAQGLALALVGRGMAGGRPAGR